MPAPLDRPEVSRLAQIWRPSVKLRCGVGRPAHNVKGDPRTTGGRISVGAVLNRQAETTRDRGATIRLSSSLSLLSLAYGRLATSVSSTSFSSSRMT